ncbi:hypothetical protein [Hymenobacter ruricola]|uniref:ArsR family transcriptional regulator n=1 Tax=Hymenobacter ruricola TaxID=2791023 RepID=A0ABS0IA30_9BACT|nr:hypothetical protein [Hymenobacter ruricola]MBF9223826.1 hypothetical protein [Hymenobacter ruricola]
MPKNLSADALVAAFAERVARRDDPPPPDPARFEAPQVLGRLVQALRPLTGMRTERGRATLARMCYAFVAAPEHSGPALAEAAGVGEIAACRARGHLRRVGLLENRYGGGHRRYRLTRFGEDWLLAVVQGTKIPGPGVG